MEDVNSVPMIIRREIEALIAAPLIRAFMERFGREPALEVTHEVIASLARQAGKLLQTDGDGGGLEAVQEAFALFSQARALEFDVIEATPVKVSINVTRCKYAEMYRELGLQEFGSVLSCARDFAFMEGLNPRIQLVRTQTLMQGAAFCDFRFTVEEE